MIVNDLHFERVRSARQAEPWPRLTAFLPLDYRGTISQHHRLEADLHLYHTLLLVVLSDRANINL